jgi:predicted Ser/Thr protein kinase/HEAT repeat protein
MTTENTHNQQPTDSTPSHRSDLPTQITGPEGAPHTPASRAEMPTQISGENPETRTQTIPDRIGRYRVKSLLGSGGMGDTYLAHDPETDRDVAVKCLRVADDNSTERFIEEVRATAQLDHPGIVRIFDVHTDNETLHYAMEYVDGESLAEIADREGKLSTRSAAEVTKEIAEALDHAHSRGIVHRDIKPANILIDKNGQPRIVDFGLAKRIDLKSLHLTQTGQILGTPTYMSPEQAAGQNKTIDGRTDIYSLGCVFYRLLTGREPFTADTAIGLLKKILDENPLNPERLTPELPGDESAICLKALEKLPRHRYATGAEFAEDLGRFLEGRPTIARPVGPIGRLQRYTLRHRKRLTALAFLVLACAAILAYTGSVFAYRNHLSVLREQEGLPPEDGEEYPIGFLIRAIGEAEAETRIAALTGLSRHKDKRATKAILAAVADKEVAVRLRVVGMVGAVPPEMVVELLRPLCLDDSPFVRGQALAQVAAQNIDGLESEIVKNLTHSDEWVRSPARRALAMTIPRARGEALTREILADAKAPLAARIGLLQAMSAAMLPPQLDIAVKCLQAEDDSLRKAAHNALRRATGKSMPPDHAQWQSWLKANAAHLTTRLTVLVTIVGQDPLRNDDIILTINGSEPTYAALTSLKGKVEVLRTTGRETLDVTAAPRKIRLIAAYALLHNGQPVSQGHIAEEMRTRMP